MLLSTEEVVFSADGSQVVMLGSETVRGNGDIWWPDVRLQLCLILELEKEDLWAMTL